MTDRDGDMSAPSRYGTRGRAIVVTVGTVFILLYGRGLQAMLLVTAAWACWQSAYLGTRAAGGAVEVFRLRLRRGGGYWGVWSGSMHGILGLGSSKEEEGEGEAGCRPLGGSRGRRKQEGIRFCFVLGWANKGWAAKD